jgi:MEMO1 family protein
MNLDPEFCPKLRNVDPLPVMIQGRQVIWLKDPLQLADSKLYMERQALSLLALLDGKHSLRDIQEQLTRQTGQIIFLDQLGTVLQKLDEALLLDGSRFRQVFQEKVYDYRKQSFRPQSHAGLSYSSDPEKLKNELNEYFVRNGGPGLPDFFSGPERPKGLVAPHIDVRAGASCFAQAYHALATGKPSDIYLILGTGHAGVERLFTATSLDFETPLGTVHTDRDFVDALSNELGRDAAAEEILHANEHVIEFQLIFLQYLLSDRHSFSIVPILCSFPHHIFDQDQTQQPDRIAFDQFCHALREVCRRTTKSVCFIASADLAHIGPRYGDNFVPHQGTISDVLQKDMESLGYLQSIDVQGFIRSVVRDHDSRRICGFPPITTMFHCMDAKQGQLLSLDFAQVDDRNSFVSFTSMIFY